MTRGGWQLYLLGDAQLHDLSFLRNRPPSLQITLGVLRILLNKLHSYSSRLVSSQEHVLQSFSAIILSRCKGSHSCGLVLVVVGFQAQLLQLLLGLTTLHPGITCCPAGKRTRSWAIIWDACSKRSSPSLILRRSTAVPFLCASTSRPLCSRISLCKRVELDVASAHATSNGCSNLSCCE